MDVSVSYVGCWGDSQSHVGQCSFANTFSFLSHSQFLFIIILVCGT